MVVKPNDEYLFNETIGNRRLEVKGEQVQHKIKSSEDLRDQLLLTSFSRAMVSMVFLWNFACYFTSTVKYADV